MVSGGSAIFLISGNKNDFLSRLKKQTPYDEPDFSEVKLSDTLEVVTRYKDTGLPLIIPSKRFKNRLLFINAVKERNAPIIIFFPTEI